MEVESDQSTSICGHCDRAVPSSNINLHFAHCSRNLQKCKICGDMIPKRHADEHFESAHAPVSCSLCSETMERESLAVHTDENCSRRIVTCEFCEFPLPAVDLIEHQEVCGNRTELCHMCHKYIRLQERIYHETNCTGVSSLSVGPSRDVGAAERDHVPRPPRRQPRDFSHRGLLFTIVITGIAVLLGSLFFPRKTDHDQLH